MGRGFAALPVLLIALVPLTHLYGVVGSAFAATCSAVVAMVVMMNINARIAQIVFLPLAFVTVFAKLAVKQFEKYRKARRKAAGKVTDFVGEMFGAAQAVKVATSEQRMLKHFRELNETRRKAALRMISRGGRHDHRTRNPCAARPAAPFRHPRVA